MMKLFFTLNKTVLLRQCLFLILLLLAGQPGFSQGDPDIPDFARYKTNKEEFMQRRAEGVALKRGVEPGKPFDPAKRIEAVRLMELQKAQRRNSPNSVVTPDANWMEIGPNPIPNGQVGSGPQLAVSGRTVAIAIHPTNPDIVYVGTAQGGLYRTLNGGTTWEPLLDNALSLAIGAVAISPSSPETVYVGTGESGFSADSYFGVGVYRIDNASSGTPTITGPLNDDAGNADIFTGRAISRILVHPTNPAIIFVASASGIGGISGSAFNILPSRGIYRCTDATSADPTFTKLTGLLGNVNASVSDMALDPLNPDLLVCNLINTSAGTSGIYVSTNALSGSPTFTQRFVSAGTSSNTARGEFAIQHTSGPNPVIYAALAEGTGSVFINTDGGTTWTLQVDNNFCNPQCFYDIAIGVDPVDPTRVYLGGSPTLAFGISTTSGTSFVSSASGLHVDSHVIGVAPSDPSIVYFGSDGGIYKSTNSGASWASLNNTTFRATQFMSIDVHPTDPNFSIGGTQDNGTNYYSPAAIWLRVDGGDGGYAVIDQNAADLINVRQYHTYFNATNLQGYGTTATVGGGWSFRGCQTTGGTVNGITCNGSINFYAPLERGPGNPNTIYYGSDRLYRSDNNGTNHTVVSQNPIVAGVPISAIGISAQNDNVRIVGLNNGGIFGTTTGSTTLDNLDAGGTVPNNYIARAVIDPTNVNTAYVTISAFGVVNIWKTTNLDNANPAWGSVASGIPQVPVNAFVVDPANSNNLYAGTDIGVYASTNAGASWAPLGTGLPVVAVFDMSLAPGGKLRIATHGRGMWEYTLAPAVAPTVTINQAAAQADPTSTSPINFTVVFNEAVTGFTNTDITLSGTAGATTAVITGAGPTYNVAVSGMTSSGTVIAAIPAGVVTATSSGMTNDASTSTDNQVTYNLVPPSVTINQAVAQADPTSTSPINFTVVFNEAVTGFTNTDITLSGTAGATTAVITGAGPTYNVAVSGMTSSGTVIASIAAGVANSVATGAGNTASTSTDNQVTYDATCNISSAIFSNTGPCNDNGTPADPSDDFFTADVTVTFSNAPATGTLEFEPGNDAIPGGGALSVSVVGLTSPYTFTGVRFKADGTVTVVEIEFSAETTCVRTASGPTVASCSAAVCNISSAIFSNVGPCNDNGTPADLTDDFFTADVTVTFANAPATGTLEFEPGNDAIPGGGALSVSVVGLTSPYTFTGVRFKADGTVTVVEIEFSAQTSCVRTASGPTVASCSGVCTLTCPANITVSNDPNQCGAVVTYPAPTTSGSCGTVTASPASGSFFPVGTTTVNVSSSTGGGTCSFTVTVNDTQPPTITCPANITTGSTAGLCSAVVNYSTPTASDNCPGVTLTRIAGPASGSSFPVGSTTITYRATDAAGNTAQCSFTVTVNDVQPPTITCPANIVRSNDANQCGAVVTFTVGATDNCAVQTLTQSTSQSITPGSVSCNAATLHTDNSYWRAYQLSSPGPISVSAVTFGIEVANASGTGTTQPVTVRVHTSAGAFPGGTLTQVATQTYNISDQSATLFTASLSSPPVVAGNSILVLEVFTPSGQSAGHSFFIGSNASGQSAPSYISASDCGVTAPTNLASIGFPNMHIVLNATITGNVPVVSSPASGSFFPIGTTTVNNTATDLAGNISTCSFTVTVNDTQLPTISCPSNITATTAVGSCTASITSPDPVIADNCVPTILTWTMTGATTGSSAASGINNIGTRTFNIGVTTVTYIVSDAAGNTATCSYTVTVLDGQLPVISIQPVNRTLCAGETAVFSVTATNAVSYQWQLWNGSAWVNVTGATSSSLTLTNVSSALNTNSYRVQVIGLCTTVTSTFATLHVNPLPTISISASPSSVLTPGQSTTLTTSTNQPGGTYVWYKNGQPTGATGPGLGGLTVDDIGNYHVVYTDPNGCVSTSAIVEVSAQVSDIMWVYPNPNFGQFQVRVYSTGNTPFTINVYDSKGAKVYARTATPVQAYTSIPVDLGYKAMGVYVVELRDASGNRLGTRLVSVNSH
jgi:hypothetical protein